eukprot:TRINITY_DN9858_c2_g2_i1.p1 TRINITY_DN9858_c2_g2~~TRINITY_DN9858_c2_g2_i1.p1  ORF type:complete len:1074 (+),score=209.77 TRINITY_DN9858_c2_g2_i1:124-3345(+)
MDDARAFEATQAEPLTPEAMPQPTSRSASMDDGVDSSQAELRLASAASSSFDEGPSGRERRKERDALEVVNVSFSSRAQRRLRRHAAAATLRQPDALTVAEEGICIDADEDVETPVAQEPVSANLVDDGPVDAEANWEPLPPLPFQLPPPRYRRRVVRRNAPAGARQGAVPSRRPSRALSVPASVPVDIASEASEEAAADAGEADAMAVDADPPAPSSSRASASASASSGLPANWRMRLAARRQAARARRFAMASEAGGRETHAPRGWLAAGLAPPRSTARRRQPAVQARRAPVVEQRAHSADGEVRHWLDDSEADDDVFMAPVVETPGVGPFSDNEDSERRLPVALLSAPPAPVFLDDAAVSSSQSSSSRLAAALSRSASNSSLHAAASSSASTAPSSGHPLQSRRPGWVLPDPQEEMEAAAAAARAGSHASTATGAAASSSTSSWMQQFTMDEDDGIFAPPPPLHARPAAPSTPPPPLYPGNSSFGGPFGVPPSFDEGAPAIARAGSDAAPRDSLVNCFYVEAVRPGVLPRACSWCQAPFVVGQLRLGLQHEASALEPWRPPPPRWVHASPCAGRMRLVVRPGMERVSFAHSVSLPERDRILRELSAMSRRSRWRSNSSGSFSDLSVSSSSPSGWAAAEASSGHGMGSTGLGGAGVRPWDYAPARLQQWASVVIPEPDTQLVLEAPRAQVSSARAEGASAAAALGIRSGSTVFPDAAPGGEGYAQLQRVLHGLLVGVGAATASGGAPFQLPGQPPQPPPRPPPPPPPFAPFAGGSQDQAIATRMALVRQAPVERLTAKSTEECIICREPMDVGDECRRLPCLHIFHKDCIDKWFEVKPTCPLDNLSLQEMLNWEHSIMCGDCPTRATPRSSNAAAASSSRGGVRQAPQGNAPVTPMQLGLGPPLGFSSARDFRQVPPPPNIDSGGRRRRGRRSAEANRRGAAGRRGSSHREASRRSRSRRTPSRSAAVPVEPGRSAASAAERSTSARRSRSRSPVRPPWRFGGRRTDLTGVHAHAPPGPRPFRSGAAAPPASPLEATASAVAAAAEALRAATQSSAVAVAAATSQLPEVLS